jgi:hypothetical protein
MKKKFVNIKFEKRNKEAKGPLTYHYRKTDKDGNVVKEQDYVIKDVAREVALAPVNGVRYLYYYAAISIFCK